MKKERKGDVIAMLVATVRRNVDVIAMLVATVRHNVDVIARTTVIQVLVCAALAIAIT